MARFDKLLCSSNCTDLFNCRTKEEMYRHLSIEVEEPIANEKGDREEPAEVKWSVQNGLKKFFAPEKRFFGLLMAESKSPSSRIPARPPKRFSNSL